ncbi:MAG: glycosyltransferase [Cyanobacteria bacterium P01_H01_bin.15]
MYPSLSVIIVSDYEDSVESKSWSNERSILSAIANQDYSGQFDVLLVENKAFEQSVPAELFPDNLDVKTVFCEKNHSPELKNYGVSVAQSELVAILEADCIPNPEWLRLLVESLTKHPEMDCASGRTLYGTKDSYQRCLSLLDRGFDDLGASGNTPFLCINGAVYRRSVFEKVSFPAEANPFLAGHLFTVRLRRQGCRFFFEKDAYTVHQIGGFDFLIDFRRNSGAAIFAAINTIYGKTHWLKIAWQRASQELSTCSRLGKKYLYWQDWLWLPGLFLAARFFEIQGLLAAHRGETEIPGSAYR